MSSCASTKPNFGRSTNSTFLAPSSDLVNRSIRHLVIASPLEPLNEVDRNFPTLIVSVCSFASKKNSGQMMNLTFRFPASLSVTIGYILSATDSFDFHIRTNLSHV